MEHEGDASVATAPASTLMTSSSERCLLRAQPFPVWLSFHDLAAPCRADAAANSEDTTDQPTADPTVRAAANVVSALSHPEQPSHWPTTPRFQPEWPATWVAALVSAPDWTRGWMAAPPPSQLQWRGSSAASTRPCGRPARGDRGVMPCAWIRTASATTAIASGRRGAAPGPAACVFFFRVAAPRICRQISLSARSDRPREARARTGFACERARCGVVRPSPPSTLVL